jgi:hypothetical protein
MIESWLYQHHKGVNLLLAWYNINLPAEPTPGELTSLRHRFLKMTALITNKLEKKLEGTLWSGMGRRISTDSISRATILQKSRNPTKRALLLWALQWRFNKGEKKGQLAEYEEEEAEKTAKELQVFRTWQEETLFERWEWLLYIRLTGTALEYSKAKTRFLEDSNGSAQVIGPRLSKNKEMHEKMANIVESIREWQRETFDKRWQYLNDVRRTGTVAEYEEAIANFVGESADPGSRMSEELEMVGDFGVDVVEDEPQAEKAEMVCRAGLYRCKCLTIIRGTGDRH